MSDVTTPYIKVEPSINPQLATGDQKLCASFYVTPVGFDAAQKQENKSTFCGALIDLSGSMARPLDGNRSSDGSRIGKAVEGLNAFLTALKPTDRFAIYTFGRRASRLFPQRGNPVEATASNISAARKLVTGLEGRASEGDTILHSGLQLFREDVEALGIGQAYLGLLTDGDYSDAASVNNELRRYEALRKEKNQAINVLSFGCGLDWKVPLLRSISDATLSSPPVPLLNAAEVTAAFQYLAVQAAEQTLTGVRLVIKKAQSVPILSCSVQSPISLDLMPMITSHENETRINLGSWDNETRLFYVELGVTKPSATPVMVACILWFEYDFAGQTQKTKAETVKVTWTDDVNLSKVIARGVAAAQGTEGSKVRIREAVQKAEAGNITQAEGILGEQYKLANQRGDTDLMAKLEEYVTVLDAVNGIVKLKNTNRETLMSLDSQSSVIRRRKPAGQV